MKKLIQLLLAIVISINTVSYNPNIVFGIDNEEIIEEINDFDEDVIIDESEDEEIIIDEDEEEIIIDDDEDIEDDIDVDDEIVIDDEDDDILIDEEDHEIEEEIDDEDDFNFVPGVIDVYVDVDRYIVEKPAANLLMASNDKADALPSKFRLDNVDGKSYLTSIKNQGNYGSCWAHAVLASAESTSIMDGEADNSFDLSEVNLNYFEYNNHYADLLDLITDDYSVCENTGDGNSDEDLDRCVFNQGGSVALAIMNLPSGIGFSYESRLPYNILPTNEASFRRADFDNKYIKGHEDWCYDNDFYVVNVDSFNLKDNKDEIKKKLMSDGAMAVSYYHKSTYYNSTNKSYYNGSTASSNHAVTLVGWDDNFDKSKFNTQPKNNGAWIIKNSWDDDWGDKGYFYISYEDVGLTSSLAYQFDIVPADDDMRLYQYDGTFCNWTYSAGTTTHYEANNYVAQRDEYIDRVGFYTTGASVGYTAYVYKNNTSNSKPTSGDLVASTSGTATYGGYHSVTLDKPVFVNEGDSFSVVVKFTGTNSKSFYVDQTIDYSTWWYNTNSDYSSGQSYYSSNATSWTDAGSNYDGNLRIKGYSNSELLNSDNTYVSFIEGTGIVIYSKSDSLISQTDKVTVDGLDLDYIKNTNTIVISENELFDNGFTCGDVEVVISTKDKFEKSFEVEVNIVVEIPENIYLGFTSDIHNLSSNVPADRLNNWINNVSANKINSKFMNFVSCGDMGQGSNSSLAADTYWSYAQKAIDVIRQNSNIVRSGFFVTGNHEFSNGKFDTSTNTTKKYYTVNGKSYVDNDGGYILYSFGATSGSSDNLNYYIQDKDVEALDKFLSTAPTNKPIFVISHYPLHNYSNRTIHGLGETIDVLNKYGDNHTIIYIWGHSHSEAGTSSSSEKHYDQVFVNEITNYDKNNTNISINFTYASAGCMADSEVSTESGNVKGKGLVAKIESNKVILTYYGINYNVVGTSTTINYKTGTPQSTRYTVNFDAGDGEASFTSKSVMKNSTYGKLPTASKSGCDFLGWFTELEGGTQITPDSKASISSNQTLYAHYGQKKVTVTFNKGSGSNLSYSCKQYTYGEAYGDLPTVSAPTSRSFSGWYTASSGGDLVTIWSIVNSEDDITLYAQYVSSGSKITFNLNDGSGKSIILYRTKKGKYETLPTPTRIGYTFTGWYTGTSSGTKIETTTKVDNTNSISLYAHWTANTYTVTYDKNYSGSTSSTKQQTYDSNYSLPTNPTRSGFDFIGWFTEKDGGSQITSSTVCKTASNHTLYAHWGKESFTITYNLNGGTNNSSNISKYNEDTEFTLLDPSRTGYKFEGWYTSSQFTSGTKITIINSNTCSGNITLYAKWTAIKYNVTFNYNYTGPQNEVIEQTYDSNYVLPETPSRTGYTFNGWFTAATGGSEVTTSSKFSQTNSNQVLYAHWTIKKYTVTFDANGHGIAPSNQTINHGSKVTKPSNLSATGYTFGGWYKEKECNNAWDFTNNTVTSDITLFAKWIANTYSVKFNINGGTSGTMDNQSFTYDVAQNLSENKFTRTGYTFAGWATSSTGNAKYSDKESVSNLTSTNNGTYNLYAKWTANKHKVTFDSAGGSACSQIEVTYDGTYSNLPTPTRTGYDFAGWYRNDTKVEKTDKVQIDAAETLVAHWTIKKYTVTWKNSDGTTLKVDNNVEYGSMPSYDGEEPTKAASAQYTYTFKGWDKTPTVVTGDVTYTATYTSTVRKYDVSIVVNNSEYGTVSTNKVSVDYGTVIDKASTTTPNQIKVGSTTITATPTSKTAQYTYTFTGWSITSNTTVTGELTITVNFFRTTNKYTVKFVNYDDTVLKSSSLEYGDMPSYSGTPSRNATAQYTYTFTGWDKTISEVTGDVTYKATYSETLNKYTVTFNANGHGTAPTNQTIDYGNKVSKPNNLSATGYTFGGWYKEQACTNAWNFDNDTITGDKTLYAKWTANTYNISYVLNDGNHGTYHPTTATYDSSFTVSNPTRTGYSFAGWKITGMDTGTHTYGSSTTTGTTINSTKATTYKNLHATKDATVTFTALWSEADVNYKVNHYLMNVNGSGYTLNKTTTESGKSDSSVTVSSLKNEDYTGFTYEGGIGRTSTSSTKPASFNTNVTISPSGNTVVDIFYSRNKYTVTFNANGHGTAPAQLTNVYYGTKISSPGSLTVTGYTFGGWYKEQACTNAWNFTSDTVSKDTTLYAKWTANNNTAYKVLHYQEKLDGTYELKDTENKTGTTGSSVSATSKSYTGFTYDSSNSKNVKSGTISGDGSLTLKLYYKRNTHTVTFKDGSTTLKTYSNVKYGTAISSLSNIPTPTKTGYTFDGWDPSITSLTLGDDNLTISAKWAEGNTAYVVNHYLMNVSGSGYTKKSTVDKVGKSNATITISSLQDTFTGFTYDGGKSRTTTSSTKPSTYDTIATINANGSTVIDLYYTRNRYVVTLNKGTGIASVTGANTYYYGATVSIDATVSTGYTWSKWTNGSSDVSTTKAYSFTMPNNAVSYTANATANTYTVSFNNNNGSGTMSNQTFKYDESKALSLNTFSRSSYVFSGWATSSSGSVVYTDGATVKNLTSTNGATVTLYAIWEKESDNTISINKGSSLSIGDTVYVNGKAVKVNSSGKIVAEKADTYVITKYTIANSSDSDRHTQYPSKTEVYFVDNSNNATLNSNFTDILKYAGASIRVTGNKGIRIITSIPTSMRNSLINSNYNGYKVMEYGTVMCWASDLAQGEEPTIYKDSSGAYVAKHGAKGRAYSRNDKINSVFKESGGVTQYTNTLVGEYTNAQCASDFAMRSYIILRPTSATDSSKDIVIYGGTLFRSISYVAYQNRNAFTPGTSAYEYIWNLIKAGYGDQYNSEYKKG